TMADERKDQDENPLENLAEEISQAMQGTTVEVAQTFKDSVEGGQVHMADSAARSVSASALRMEDAAAGIVHSGSVDATESLICVATAEVMNLHDTNVILMAADRVEAKDGVRAFVLFAQRVEGPVNAVLTPLAALAAGAGLALGVVAFRRFFSWVFRRPLRRGHA
ncbi:MAG: hypothetical protein QM346_14385, partial [Chloroflexota bacterium]|nr:hypothetical protein [Chloroflexota bacterium]